MARIGNQIDAAMILAGADFVNVHKQALPDRSPFHFPVGRPVLAADQQWVRS